MVRSLFTIALSLHCMAAFNDGLAGRWLFTDGALGKDQSPRANDAALVNASVRSGRAYFGGSAYASVNDRAAIKKELTIMLWLQPSSVSAQRIIGKPNMKQPTWATPMPGIYFSDRGTISFGMWMKDGAKCVIEGRTAIPAQVWTCIAVSCDGATARLFINGQEDGAASYAGDIEYPDTPLFIGRIKSTDKFFRGTFGDVLLFERGLSAAEVASYAGETRASYPLVAAAPERRSVIVAVKRGPSETAWKEYRTHTLDLLEGFTPSGDAVQYDRYGGRTDKKSDATGFFYPKKIDDRWLLIDPDGGYFFHTGIVSVGSGGGPTVKANFAGRFASKEEWADSASALLKENGFNGTGAWSDIEALRAAKTKLVYTVMLNFMADFAKSKKLNAPGVGHSGYVKDCIPVFHPDFPSFCAEYAKKLAPLKGDPYLLGIFSDNELLTPELSKYLSLDVNDSGQKPNHDAAVAWLAERTQKQHPGKGDITDELRSDFMGYVFDRYYGIVSKAIRAVDADHLYIGSRLHSSELKSLSVWKAAGTYLDVVSVNYYGVWGPDLDQMQDWHAWSGKPCIITEWYAKGDDRGFPNTTGAGWLVKTQRDRGLYYQHYLMGLIESGTCVGSHWFKYMDNDTNDMNAEPSNRDSNKGIVQVTFDPYTEVLSAMRAVNREVYPLMDFFDAKKKKGVPE